jgi:hypothetical protein
VTSVIETLVELYWKQLTRIAALFPLATTVCFTIEQALLGRAEVLRSANISWNWPVRLLMLLPEFCLDTKF